MEELKVSVQEEKNEGGVDSMSKGTLGNLWSPFFCRDLVPMNQNPVNSSFNEPM